jgi:hypothetical protein
MTERGKGAVGGTELTEGKRHVGLATSFASPWVPKRMTLRAIQQCCWNFHPRYPFGEKSSPIPEARTSAFPLNLPAFYSILVSQTKMIRSSLISKREMGIHWFCPFGFSMCRKLSGNEGTRINKRVDNG